MKLEYRRWYGIIVMLVLCSILLLPIKSIASEEGRRNTAIGLGALTGYLFTQRGSKVPAFMGATATLYAYKRYQDAINARHKRERYYAEENAYQAGYSDGKQRAVYIAQRDAYAHQEALKKHAIAMATQQREQRLRAASHPIGASLKQAQMEMETPVAAAATTSALDPKTAPTKASGSGNGMVGGMAAFILGLGAALGAPRLWRVAHSRRQLRISKLTPEQESENPYLRRFA